MGPNISQENHLDSEVIYKAERHWSYGLIAKIWGGLGILVILVSLFNASSFHERDLLLTCIFFLIPTIITLLRQKNFQLYITQQNLIYINGAFKTSKFIIPLNKIGNLRIKNSFGNCGNIALTIDGEKALLIKAVKAPRDFRDKLLRIEGTDFSDNAETIPEKIENAFKEHKVLAVIICLLLIGFVIGHNDPSIYDDQKATIKISAEELGKQYENNEINADQLYKNKWLRVAGTIDEISKDPLTNKPYISLKTNEFGLKIIRCDLNDAEYPKAARLNKGNAVVLSGWNTGKTLLCIMLTNCTIE